MHFVRLQGCIKGESLQIFITFLSSYTGTLVIYFFIYLLKAKGPKAHDGVCGW